MALLIALGTILCFLDSDDTLPNNALTTLYNGITEGFDIVKGRMVRVYNNESAPIVTNANRHIYTGTTEIVKRIFSGDIEPFYGEQPTKENCFPLKFLIKVLSGELHLGKIG